MSDLGHIDPEIWGYAFHRTRAAFERDRGRDADLQRHGYRVVRITSRRLERGPVAVAEMVQSLLAGGAQPPEARAIAAAIRLSGGTQATSQ